MDDQRRHQGMSVRRAVLGDPQVDRATAATTELTADFQDLITRYGWGEIWSRPGLDRRTRSCITLAMLAALSHEEELAMHVRAALHEGRSCCWRRPAGWGRRPASWSWTPAAGTPPTPSPWSAATAPGSWASTWCLQILLGRLVPVLYALRRPAAVRPAGRPGPG